MISFDGFEELLGLSLLLLCICEHVIFYLSEVLSLLLVSDTCDKATFWDNEHVLICSLDVAPNHGLVLRVLELDLIVVKKVLGIGHFFTILEFELVSWIHVKAYLRYSINPIVVKRHHRSALKLVVYFLWVVNVVKSV